MITAAGIVIAFSAYIIFMELLIRWHFLAALVGLIGLPFYIRVILQWAIWYLITPKSYRRQKGR